jgi:hypothetical protein
MKRLSFIITMIIYLLALTGCVSHVIKPNTPFERPAYTIYSPQGEGWLFFEGDQSGVHNLLFGLPQKSRTNTIYANVQETPSDAIFSTPQEFQSFIQKQNQVGIDHRRYNIVEEELNLDNKFGDFSVSYYTLVEDHGARQLSISDTPYLLMKTWMYYFIHPSHNKQIISLIYSERGKQGELDEKFREKAQMFFDGLHLKK